MSSSEYGRKRIELTYIVGWSDNDHSNDAYMVDAFESSIIRHASGLCGGCFVATGDGYWMDSEDTHRPVGETFGGELNRERSLCVKLTTELEKETWVLESMQNHIALASRADRYNMPIDWVHVQRVEITGLHFSAKALREDA